MKIQMEQINNEDCARITLRQFFCFCFDDVVSLYFLAWVFCVVW